jgi:hypothetical protein
LNLARTQPTRSFQRRKTSTRAGTLVDKSAEIQADYSKCTDEDSKRKIAMEYHTSMRSFHEVAFCCAGVKEEWKATVKGGLVFSPAVASSDTVVRQPVSLWAY